MIRPAGRDPRSPLVLAAIGTLIGIAVGCLLALSGEVIAVVVMANASAQRHVEGAPPCPAVEVRR